VRPIRPLPPRPQPTPSPKPTPTPEQAHDIDWIETSPAVEVTSELKKEKPNFYTEFEGLSKYDGDKGLVVFVYWESDDASTDKEDKKKIEKSQKMDEMLKADCLKVMADTFIWVRLNGRELDKELAKRHKIYKVPCVLLVDIRGKKWYILTNHLTKPKRFLKTLKKFESFNNRLRRMLKR